MLIGDGLTSRSDTERVQVITSSGNVCPVCKVITTSTSIARGDDFAVIGGVVGIEIDLLPMQHARCDIGRLATIQLSILVDISQQEVRA